MRMLKMKYILLFTLVCYSALTHSQTPFTLKDCLEEGLEKNYSVRIARNEGDMSKNSKCGISSHSGFIGRI